MGKINSFSKLIKNRYGGVSSSGDGSRWGLRTGKLILTSLTIGCLAFGLNTNRLHAQNVINTTVGSTGYTGSNSSGTGQGITFVVNNTNNDPIMLSAVGDWSSASSNGLTYTLYYSSTSLGGTPATSFPATGWTQVATGQASGITNSTMSVNDVLTGLNFTIPGNTAYRFSLVTSGTRYYSGSGVGSCTPDSFVSNGVKLYVGDYSLQGGYVGYGYTNNPRFFTGSITFVPLTPCTGAPVAGVTQLSNHNLCIGQSVDLSVTGSTIGTGLTYQWESATSANGTYTPIAGATGPTYTYTTNTSGTTFFRLALTCSGQTSYSNPDSIVVPNGFPGGTYSINPNQPVSATNFQTVSDAFAAVGCGITGNVVFNMAAGNTFNEQVTIPPTMGATASRTVTLNGNGDTLTYSANAGSPWTLGIEGSGHITVNDLVIQGTSTSNALVTHLWNGADSNTFNNCTILAPFTTSSSIVPFSVSGTAISATGVGISGSGNVLNGCKLLGGYYGATFYGGAGNLGVANKILNSTIQDFYNYGSFNYYQDGLVISGNHVFRPTLSTVSTFYGIYISTGCTNVLIEKNRLDHQNDGDPSGAHAVYNVYVSSSSATPGNEIKIFNNVIGNVSGNSTVGGIYLPSAVNTQVYYNTISIDNTGATTGTVYGVYSAGTTNIDIRNNVVYIAEGGSGTKNALYFTGAGKTSDYNNIFFNATGGSNVFGYFSFPFTTFAAWQGANGGTFDQNSISDDPLFADPQNGNFAPTNVAVNDKGTPITAVTTDILGNPRSATTPDMGAYEFSVAACNGMPTGGITGVSDHLICQGDTITLNATGSTLATGLTYQWESSNSLSGTYTAIPGANTLSYATAITTPGVTYFRLAVTCSGQTAYSTPDSTFVSTGLPGGSYTINPNQSVSSTNFQTVSDAFAATGCGITGSVIFNMASGNTFNEQVTVPGAIGTTAAKTVTINGNGDTLSFAGTSSNPWTLGISGVGHITVNDLTIQGTNASAALVVHLWNGADSNSFNRCNILAPFGSSTLSIPFSVSGSPTAGTASGLAGNGNILDSCNLVGGYYGATFYALSSSMGVGNKILNSTVQDFYTYGIYNYYQNGLVISGNHLFRPNATTVSSFYGIYVSTGCTDVLLEKNRLDHQNDGDPTGAHAVYNIYVSSTSATAGDEIKVINNVIGNLSGNTTSAGIYLPSAVNVQVYNNTISMDNVAATAGTIYGIYSTGTTNVDIQNNLLNITQGGTGTKYGLYFSGAGKTSNYNDIFIGSTTGTNNYGYYSGAFNSFAGWQGANGGAFDQNSISADPMFLNIVAGNFTPTNPAVDDKGTPIAGVTTDILGVTRNTTTPDIGAYEFNVGNCSGLVSAGSIDTTAAFNVCATNSLSLSTVGTTLPAGGLVYQWQQRVPSGTGSWQDIAGATGLNLILPNGITVPTDFRLYVACSFSNNSDTSSVVTANINPASQCYCTPPAPSIGGLYWIESFSTTGVGPNISNLNTGASASGYVDYTMDTVGVLPGGSFNFNLQAQAGSSPGVSIWVDWNQNGVFEANELAYDNNGGSSSSLNTYIDSIIAPTSAALGTTRLRIRNYTNRTPCDLQSYGEAEDYTVKVLPLAACNTVNLPSNIASLINEDTICVGGNINLDIDTVLVGFSGFSYQWQKSANGTSGWTNLGSAQPTSIYTDSALAASTWYRCQILCDGTLDVTTNVISVFVSNPGLGTIPSDQDICGTSSVTLNATATGGSSVHWYDADAGGNLLGTGNSYTDTFSQTDTVWVSAGTGGGSTPQSLLTTTAAGNGANGNLFDIDVTNTIRIDSFSIAATTPGTQVGIYYRVGTGTGFNTSNAGWTLLGTATINNVGSPLSVIPLFVNLTLSPGTYSFALATSTTVNYTNGTTLGNVFVSDANVAIKEGYGGSTAYPGFGFTNQPRVWNGTLYYSLAGCETPRQPVVITVHDSVEVQLGNDTTICEGTPFTLDAGNSGSNYTWNNGATTETISVSDSGTYSVHVVAPWGCEGEDSINVNVTPLPHVDDITAVHNADDSYTFTANGATSGANYSWDFGDGHGFSSSAIPTYLYGAYGDYTVTLILSNDCGADTTQLIVHYTSDGGGNNGISNVDPGKNLLKLYPNPARDIVTLSNESSQKMQTVEVYNVLGQRIFKANTNNGSTYQLHVNGYASGMYSVKIFFEDGTWAQRKFEIAK